MNSFGKPNRNNDLAKVLTHMDADYEQVSMLIARVESLNKSNYNLLVQNSNQLTQIMGMQQQLFELLSRPENVTKDSEEFIIDNETKN